MGPKTLIYPPRYPYERVKNDNSKHQSQVELTGWTFTWGFSLQVLLLIFLEKGELEFGEILEIDFRPGVSASHAARDEFKTKYAALSSQHKYI